MPARTTRPSIQRWSSPRSPGGLLHPIASSPFRVRLVIRCGHSPKGASTPSRRLGSVQGRTMGERPSVARRLPGRPRRAKARHDRRWRPKNRPRRSSKEDRRGARPDGAWLLVASFHTRFVPPAPFLTTLTGYPSPGPSGMFHPVTLMGFGFRWNDPQVGWRLVRPEGRPIRSVPCELLRTAVSRTTVVALRPTRPWQARMRREFVRGDTPP
jgi:hypothetical protein